MRVARDEPGDYGRAFGGVRMAFEVVEADETEDHYVVTLSFRPQGDFSGTPGREQFYIEKEGAVAIRQVLALPRVDERRGFPVWRVGIVAVVVGAAAVVGVLVVVGALVGGDDERPPAAAAPLGGTALPLAAVPASPTATQTPMPPASTASPVPSPTSTLIPIPAPPTPTPTPTPTDTPEVAPEI